MLADLTIPDLLRNAAAADPDRAALIVDGSGSLSYREWDARSNAVARGLVDRAVVPGDRVALFFENADWIPFAVAYFGVLKTGAVGVPLSSRFSGPDLTAVLDGCAVTGTVWNQKLPRGPGWQATVTELERGQSEEPYETNLSAESLAEILYTSGTTGMPKGVACRHLHVVRPLTHDEGWPPRWWRDLSGQVYLHANAVSTAAGQLRLLEPLGPQKMTVVAAPAFDPNRFCELAASHRAAVVQLVPAMASAIVNTGAWLKNDLSGVKVVSLGCAPLPPSLVPSLAAAFPCARLVNLYELSEARYAGTWLVHDGTGSDSVGVPRGATELRVAGSQGEKVPPGEAGEIWLRWQGLPSQHYFRDAEATSRVFVDGWTRTGDMGYLDDSGELHLTGRLKEIIIKGGLNVSALAVENALLEHRAIADCAVFGIPDKIHGEEVAAAVVPRIEVSVGEICRFLASRLPPHAIPRRFLWLAELPRNRSGKVLKKDLLTYAQAQHGQPVDTMPQ